MHKDRFHALTIIFCIEKLIATPQLCLCVILIKAHPTIVQLPADSFSFTGFKGQRSSNFIYI